MSVQEIQFTTLLTQLLLAVILITSIFPVVRHKVVSWFYNPISGEIEYFYDIEGPTAFDVVDTLFLGAAIFLETSGLINVGRIGQWWHDFQASVYELLINLEISRGSAAYQEVMERRLEEMEARLEQAKKLAEAANDSRLAGFISMLASIAVGVIGLGTAATGTARTLFKALTGL